MWEHLEVVVKISFWKVEEQEGGTIWRVAAMGLVKEVASGKL